MRRSHRLLLSLVMAVPVVGCGSRPVAHGTTGASVARSTTYDAPSRTHTEVTVVRDEPAPKNSMCVLYCERLTECRDAIGYIDPTLSSKELGARCEVDENDCQQPTTEAECCAMLTDDCQSFARCQAQGSALPSACQPGRGAKKPEMARASCPPGAPCASL